MRLFSIDPQARSRLNTAFVAASFLGGAAGSLLAGVRWQLGGWHEFIAGATMLILVAFGLWTTLRRHPHLAPAVKGCG